MQDQRTVSERLNRGLCYTTLSTNFLKKNFGLNLKSFRAWSKMSFIEESVSSDIDGT
jgi:hypothetical protein